MGIHDRGYYRDEPPPGFEVGWNQKSPVAMIIIICASCFVINLFINTPQGRFSDLAALHSSDLWRPWMWWRLLSYGFVHSYTSIGHILFNMFSLWMLGRTIEERYGWSEFWRIYILSVIFCGVCFLALHNIFGSGGNHAVIGASGAVLSITMLFVFNYPRNTLMMFGVIPMPAWVLGLIIVVMNLISVPNSQDNVAYDVHIAGIAFAAMYFYGNWNFSFLGELPTRWRLWKRKSFGPKLKTFGGENLDQDASEADRILEKIQRSGLDSLTSKERKFMERYSKKVREKQQS